MVNIIRCDEMDVGEEVMESNHKNKEFDNLQCSLDVDYTTKTDGEFFYLLMKFYARIFNDKDEIINLYVPYTLKYSLEKYEKHNLGEIVKSAVNEVSTDAYIRFQMIATIFYHKKLEIRERSLS